MKKNILIIDDEKRIRDTYSQVLEKAGFVPFKASNAVDARSVMMRGKIDLALLDLNMPHIKGGELFQVMKAFHKDIKVIVASVYPIDEQKKAASDADDFFDKSDGPKVLIKKIKFHLDAAVGRGKILIIDDNESIRFSYKHLLENEGYESECFSDSKTAVQYIKKKNNRFHLILLDIAMAGIDAKDIFNIIKEKHKEARVLVVSSYDVRDQENLVPHADGYFDKSDGKKVLLDKIQELVNKREGEKGGPK